MNSPQVKQSVTDQTVCCTERHHIAPTYKALQTFFTLWSPAHGFDGFAIQRILDKWLAVAF
ncbi:MAG: hypothetical protein SOW45_06420 [Prevotella sp.]|nr:hypothetical protein [Prevotella sp.]